MSRDRLARALAEGGIDAGFLWSPMAMGHLAGFAEAAGERFMALGVHKDGRETLICPALSSQQARRSGIADVRGWADGEDPSLLFKELATEWHLKTAIVGVDDEMPAHMVLAMQQVLPAALFRPIGEILGNLRRIKTADEIAKMSAAARVADEALSEGLAVLRAGVTEQAVANALSRAMTSRGGVPAFSIVATGANGAEPHHHSDHTPLCEGDVVVMDFGCSLEGYQSDITRMAAIGSPDPEADHVYDIVFRAHHAARSAAKPGVTAGSVDEAARRVIADAGYGEHFIHRTGHGIGLRGHELPNIVNGSNHILEVGECFSIEPGVYLPGRFGVRIENIVTLTEAGCQSLNEEPPASLVRCGGAQPRP